jgi:acetyltransferase-like isoleucine patch superfamily enzyme
MTTKAVFDTQGDGPLCFMHIPKSAGSSVMTALEASLPDGAVAHPRMDPFIFCHFSQFDRLDPEFRSRIVVSDAEFAELARHRVVGGHFPLPKLLRLTSASHIATVLREPRARLLSGFIFGRLSPAADLWGPYGSEVIAPATRSLEAGLSDPFAAQMGDNPICRLVLRGDPRMKDGGFIKPDDAEELGKVAVERLDQLGYVGILEQDDIWVDLSKFFAAPLKSERINVSGEGDIPVGALPIPSFDMRNVLNLIEQRIAADRYVYETLLTRRCGDADEARRIADAAFAEALIRFGDLTGSAATKLHSQSTASETLDCAESPTPAVARPAGLGSLGRDSYIIEPYKIRSPHHVHIGDNVVVGERSFLSVVQSELGVEYEPELRIGDGTRIASDLFIHCAGRVEIGKDVRIGARVFIGDSGRDYDDPATPMTIAEPAPVRIGDGAVLGAGAIVLEGVTIGDCAVVEAGSVVTRNVQSGSTVLGNPARVVQTRD